MYKMPHKFIVFDGKRLWHSLNNFSLLLRECVWPAASPARHWQTVTFHNRKAPSHLICRSLMPSQRPTSKEADILKQRFGQTMARDFMQDRQEAKRWENAPSAESRWQAIPSNSWWRAERKREREGRRCSNIWFKYILKIQISIHKFSTL